VSGIAQSNRSGALAGGKKMNLKKEVPAANVSPLYLQYGSAQVPHKNNHEKENFEGPALHAGRTRGSLKNRRGRQS